LHRNIFYHTGVGIPHGGFHYGIDHVGPSLDANVYYHAEDGVAARLLDEQRERGTGNDATSIVADPGFADPLHGDFSFSDQSPAAQLGIKPLAKEIVERIGCSRDPFLARFSAGLPLQPTNLRYPPAKGKGKAKKKRPSELDL
jgi:hypothetical protein